MPLDKDKSWLTSINISMRYNSINHMYPIFHLPQSIIYLINYTWYPYSNRNNTKHTQSTSYLHWEMQTQWQKQEELLRTLYLFVQYMCPQQAKMNHETKGFTKWVVINNIYASMEPIQRFIRPQSSASTPINSFIFAGGRGTCYCIDYQQLHPFQIVCKNNKYTLNTNATPHPSPYVKDILCE